MDTRPPPTTLSFVATLVSKNRDDALREFIVVFCVEDSSFSIIERVIPNSGFQGGKFLQRTRASNPATGEPYEPDDITVGADITVAAWRFHLKSATEGTLRLMEARSDMFTQSDLSAVVLPMIRELRPRAAALRAAFERRDVRKRGRVRRDELAEVILEFRVALAEQELITLFRRFQFADSDMFEYGSFLAHLA